MYKRQAPASATIFNIGEPEKVGTFKVLDGHYKQTVGYLANYSFRDQENCWIYKYGDQGSSIYNLKFDKGEFDRWKWAGEDLPTTMMVSGTASRSWSGTVNSQETSKEDRSDCGGPTPLKDNNRSCGSATIKNEKTGFHFVGMRNGKIKLSGPDVTPFGPVLDRDPFRAHNTDNCPSDSTLGLLTIPAPDKNGLKHLDKAKIGDVVNMSGSNDLSGPGPDNFVVIGDWISGSHTAANVNWSLKLKRVKPGKKKG